MITRRRNALALAAGLVVLGVSTKSYAARTWVGGGTTTSLIDSTNWLNGTLPSFAHGTSTSSTGGNNANNDAVFDGNNTIVTVPNSDSIKDTYIRNLTILPTAGAFFFNDDGSGISEIASLTNAGTPTYDNQSPFAATVNTGFFGMQRGQILATGGDWVINAPFNLGEGSPNTINFGGAHDFYMNQGLFANGTMNKVGTGTMYLSPDTQLGFAGQVRIVQGNVVISDSMALGDPGNSNASTGWTEIAGGTGNTGGLVLTNNITVGDYIYMLGRTTFDAQIFNKSGTNVLNGIIQTETTGTDYAFESDGTAAGDLMVIGNQAQIQQPVAGVATLALRGAGNGLINAPFLDTPDSSPAAVWNLVKMDSGTWTLNGPQGHGGTTVVQQGTLAIGNQAPLASTPSIAVNSGATLDVSPAGGFSLSGSQTLKGAGSVIGLITAGGGSIIAPGDGAAGAVGTLTIGSLSLNDGTVLQYDLTNDPTSANDKIAVNGDLSLSGTTSIVINKLNGGLGTGIYRLFDYSGALSGDGSNLSLVGLSGGTSRQTFAIDTSIAHEINLDVSGNAGNLTWVGGANSNAWDVNGTINWTGASDNHFFNGDSVSFTDTGSTSPVINVVNAVAPGTINFTNSAGHTYKISGGDISVAGGVTASGTGDVSFNNSSLSVGGNLTASGAGVLTIASSNGATFTGNLTVSGSRGLKLSGGAISVAGNLTTTTSGDVTIANSDLAVTGNFSFAATGAGNITISNSGALPTVTSVALSGGTLNIARSNNTIIGAVSGTGTIQQSGSGITQLAGNNSGFGGAVLVSGGTLQTAGLNSLGSNPNSTTVLSGGTLDVDGNPSLAGYVITIAGSGAPGQPGALVDNSGLGTSGAVRAVIGGVILSADATIYSANNTYPYTVDGAVFQGNGFNLTMAGGGEWDFLDTGETHLANITFKDGGGGHGVFWVGTTTFGDQPGVITLENDGRLGIETLSAPITKPIVVTADGSGHGGIVEFGTGGANDTVTSQITMNGTLDTFTISVAPADGLILAGKLTGPGGLTVHERAAVRGGVGTTFVTSDANDFAGPITIGGGFGPTGDIYIATPANDKAILSIGNGGTTGKIGPGDVSISSVSALQFDKNATYNFPNNVSGAGGITSVATGGAVTLTGNLSYTGATTVNAGLVKISSANSSIGVVNVFGGAFEAASTQTVSGLGVASGALAQIAHGGATKNVLTVGSGGLFVDVAGIVDVSNNAMVVAYDPAKTSPLSTIQGYLATGFNAGNWDGPGINSTAAHNDATSLTGLGYAENSDLNLATLDGAPIPASAVLVKYTYYGDSNLDGSVTTADFQRFLDGLAAGGSTWDQGDYTYDGKVDLGNDFNLFLRSYLAQGGSLGALAPIVAADDQLSASQKASLLAVVPEPSSIAVLGLAISATSVRRRRR